LRLLLLLLLLLPAVFHDDFMCKEI